MGVTLLLSGCDSRQKSHFKDGDVKITVTMIGDNMFNNLSFDIDDCEIK